MSFNKPSMNGLNNFNIDEIETLITNNTNAINNKQDIIDSTNRLSATLIGNNNNVSNNEYGYSTKWSHSNIQDQLTFNALATTSNTNNIATNISNISNNTSNISNNTSNISNNTSNIATNTSNSL